MHEEPKFSETKTVYEFDAFRVDPVNRLLWRGGEVVPLASKVFDILLVFIENSGRLLEKEEVMRKVWPDSFVEEGNLARNVSTLRKTLRADLKGHQYIITVPGRGYRFVASVRAMRDEVADTIASERAISTTIIEKEISLADLRNASRTSGETQENGVQRTRGQTSNLKSILQISAACIACIALAAILLLKFVPRLRQTSGSTEPSVTVIPVTTDPGYEGMPSLSPDGNHVAYGSFGKKQDNLDIYVKLIGGGPALRLTTDPAPDEFPAWSPDGRTIAFIRSRGDKMDVILIPALGGAERKLAEISPHLPLECSPIPPYLSWFPDGNNLMTIDRASPDEHPGLFVLSVSTGEKRRVTTTPAVCDTNPAVSPDGRTVAFVRLITTAHTQLFVLPLSEDGRAAGEARRLDLPQPKVYSPAWTSDGQDIICSAGNWFANDDRIWRVSLSGSEKPQALASVQGKAGQPTISRQNNRLVYAVETGVNHIWRADLAAPDRFRAPEKLIESTLGEVNPFYSPDGSRILFCSGRSGFNEIWVCNADGSNPVQLTSSGSGSLSAGWFPDGRRIVIDSQTEGHFEIYVGDTDRSVPRRLTNESSDDATSSVSHDGMWIYFTSRRTGRWEIWRMPAEGGEAVQVTRNGGFRPCESLDGKVVYYQKAQENSDLWKVPAEGGDETRVLGPVRNGAVAVVANGIYFIQPGASIYAGFRQYSLQFFSFATSTARKVADIKYVPNIGLSVSPDGRHVLFSQRDQNEMDLMLAENFR